MRRKSSIITFVLALSAFLAAGSGVLLLVAPGGGGGGRVSARAATPAPTVLPAPVPTPPALAEYPLLANLPAIPKPGLPNRIVIASIALDAKVVDVGVVIEDGKPVWDTAAFAVGYHQGTALPGQRGNAVLSGHISSPVSRKGEVFKRLPETRIGDRVDVFVDDRRYTYEISALKVVPPTAIEVMEPTGDAVLTLITCYPDTQYTNRLVVVARLLSSPG